MLKEKNLSSLYEFDVEYWTKKMSSKIYSIHNFRRYATKLSLDQFPRHYFIVNRGPVLREIINAKSIKTLKYHWVKENHFMKDSHLEYTFNEDDIVYYVYDWSVFTFIYYIKKYNANIDIIPIRKAFIQQCKWLKENEPMFAPKTDDFGKWFDNTVEEYGKTSQEKYRQC